MVPYVRCDGDASRSSYKVDPSPSGMIGNSSIHRGPEASFAAALRSQPSQSSDGVLERRKNIEDY